MYVSDKGFKDQWNPRRCYRGRYKSCGCACGCGCPGAVFMLPLEEAALPGIPDGATDVGLNPTLAVTVSNTGSDVVTVYFWDTVDRMLFRFGRVLRRLLQRNDP